MIVWEYEGLFVPLGTPSIPKLNEWGAQGWEAVSHDTHANGVLWLMKRQKPDGGSTFRPVWEYQTMFLHHQTRDLMTQMLNTAGEQGWELVQLMPLTHDNYNALMKRMVYR